MDHKRLGGLMDLLIAIAGPVCLVWFIGRLHRQECEAWRRMNAEIAERRRLLLRLCGYEKGCKTCA